MTSNAHMMKRHEGRKVNTIRNTWIFLLMSSGQVLRLSSNICAGQQSEESHCEAPGRLGSNVRTVLRLFCYTRFWVFTLRGKNIKNKEKTQMSWHASFQDKCWRGREFWTRKSEGTCGLSATGSWQAIFKAIFGDLILVKFYPLSWGQLQGGNMWGKYREQARLYDPQQLGAGNRLEKTNSAQQICVWTRALEWQAGWGISKIVRGFHRRARWMCWRRRRARASAWGSLSSQSPAHPSPQWHNSTVSQRSWMSELRRRR